MVAVSPDKISDPSVVSEVIAKLDDLIAITTRPLPDDERAHGWDEEDWKTMLNGLTEWRKQISSRGFLNRGDTGWQLRALYDLDHVDTEYGVADAFLDLGIRVSDALDRLSNE